MELKALTEEREVVVRDLKALATVWESENRPATDDEKLHYDNLHNRQQDLDARIETAKRVAISQALSTAPNVDKPTVAAQHRSDYGHLENLAARGWFLNRVLSEPQMVTREMQNAADDLEININAPYFDIHQRDQTLNNDGEGGYLRTPSLFVGLEKRQKFYNGILDVADVQTTDQLFLNLYGYTDTTAIVANQIDELDPATDHPITLSQVNVKLYKWQSGVFPVSSEALRNSQGMQQLVEDTIGESFGRALNIHSTTGNLTYSQGFTRRATDSGITSASATAITCDELLQLKAAADQSVQDNPESCFFMTPGTWSATRRTKDANNGRYLFGDLAHETLGANRTFDGNRVVLCTAMDEATANNKAAFFGNPKAIKIRREPQIRLRTLTELYAKQDAVAWTAFHYFGLNVIDPYQLVYMTQHS